MRGLRYEGYEPLDINPKPSFWYEGGMENEMFHTDVMTVYRKYSECINKNTEREWWVITPFKPKGAVIDKNNFKRLVKWGVGMSRNDVDNGYEWDFKEHRAIR